MGHSTSDLWTHIAKWSVEKQAILEQFLKQSASQNHPGSIFIGSSRILYMVKLKKNDMRICQV